jgi:hypothetical protein
MPAWHVCSYLQGRASIEHAQPLPVCSHLTDLLAAREYLAQSLPYSKSTKSDHEEIATISAFLRLRTPELLP